MLIIGLFCYLFFTNDNGVSAVNKNAICYPLTHPQLGIWYTEKMYPGTSIGIVAATLKIKEKVDIGLLEKSINLLIKNHDCFRLHFTEIDGEPFQYFTEYDYRKIDFVDFSQKGRESLYEWDELQSKIPFKLMGCDLCYFAIVKVSEDEFGIYMKFHHLITDGWSIVKTANYIMGYYNDLKLNSNDYDNQTSTYLDLINREKEYLSSPRFIADKDFWDARFSSLTLTNNLFYRSRSTQFSTEAKRKTFAVPNKLAVKLYEYMQCNRTTLVSLLMSALAIYLTRATGTLGHVIGVPVLNRLNAREKNTCGLFVNTIPFSINIDDSISFREFVSGITQEWMSILRHQRYPYELIKKSKQDNRGSNELYEILISYQNAKITKDDGMLQNEGRWHFNGRQVTPLYIHINEREDDGSIIIDYDYLTDRFYSKEIEFMHDHIIRLLWHGIDNPDKQISRLDIMSEKEKYRILTEFNNTNADYPQTVTINELFIDQVNAHPENTAVIDHDRSITYSELNLKAEQLAGILSSNGVKPNTIVGLIIDRSIEMIIGILGILKAGGTYLPLDPSYPHNRLCYFINDSKPLLLLSSEAQYKKSCQVVEQTGFDTDRILILDHILRGSNTGDVSEIASVCGPEDTAYIIYTSGSTGAPKGVQVSHKNVVRLLFNSKFEFDFSSGDVWTMFHSYCFDFSVWEMYGALLYGGKLVIVPHIIAQDPKEFLRLLRKNKATVLNQIPTAFYNLSDSELNSKEHDLSLRYIIFGGEALKPAKLKAWKSLYPNVKLVNMYGITETTVHSTYKEVTADIINSNACNIGKPIPTTQIYILDKYQQLVPIGVKGEIYVGGEGVAKGYLNRAELTNQRFIDNPFVEGQKLYRSGDLGRWYPNGDIEYLGRLDYQVKIHGYRVELGEIENALLKFEGIKDGVVLPCVCEGEITLLNAFFTADVQVDIARLKHFLNSFLPHYMMPDNLVQIDEMPLASSGKVDKNALKQIKYEKKIESQYQPPRNETEAKMTCIWQEVLGIPKVGIKDNFFDLGGDSFNIIQVQVKSYTENWGIKTQHLYKYPTIELLYDNVISRQERINYLKNNDYNHCVPDILKPKAPVRFKNVLLTGSTGFLGIHILYYLLAESDANVYCLVRKDDITDDIDYYFKDVDRKLLERIFLLRGDITKCNLGLDENKYDFLCSSIDTIIHSAANVRHYGSYSEFHDTNVNGTLEMLKLCRRSKSVFHHISTISISGTDGFGNDTGVTDFTEDDLFVGQNIFENVYLATKLEAEKLVLQEASDGMDVNIYRMGNITGRYSDGVCQKNVFMNAFCRRLNSMIMIGAISKRMANVEIEMSPVDICGKSIVDIIKKGQINSIYHLYNKKHRLAALIDILKALDLANIQILDEMEFRTKLNHISSDASAQQSLEGIINEIGNSNGFEYNDSIKTRNEKTLKAFQAMDISWPDTFKSNYVKKLISNMIEIGFLKEG